MKEGKKERKSLPPTHTQMNKQKKAPQVVSLSKFELKIHGDCPCASSLSHEVQVVLQTCGFHV
jgi:hypothetical protein